jgi:hypothetical protein
LQGGAASIRQITMKYIASCHCGIHPDGEAST